jgi:hypothetical protein
MEKTVSLHHVQLGKLGCDMQDLLGARSENFKKYIVDSLDVKYGELSIKAMQREEELMRAVVRVGGQYDHLTHHV